MNTLALEFPPLKGAQLGNLVSHEQTQQPKENIRDDGKKKIDDSGDKH